MINFTAFDRGAPAPLSDVAGRHVLEDALLPVMTLRDSAISNNIAVLAGFASAHGLLLAPHMKTHMAPSLAARQLEAGAWGVTVASVQQARVAWETGIDHLIVANEVLDPAGLRWLAALRSPDVLVYVDSLYGVEAIRAAVTDADDLRVLIDLGWAGGRAGVRSLDEVRVLARALQALPGVTLRGISGYEGGLSSVDLARDYVRGALEAYNSLVDEKLLPAASVLSMGGSAYFDVVADVLAPRHPETTVLLRSGAYLTHDDGSYAHKGPYTRIDGQLIAAIDVWARVTSTPEPGLAIVAMGKRDAPYDEGMPVAKYLVRGGVTTSLDDTITLTRMDDQHGYLAIDGVELVPGDIIRFGISHPCTAFDKWRVLPVIDDQDRIIDTVRTFF